MLRRSESDTGMTQESPMSIDYREQYDDLLLDWENDVETSPSLRDTPWDQWTNVLHCDVVEAL